MNQPQFFSIRLRKYTQFFFFVLCILFSYTNSTAAKDLCPQSNDPETVAIKYKLYTAYQVAYDGYETPCEIQCLKKKDCRKRCQQKKGLSSLENKMKELTREKGNCPSIALACLEQCQTLGKACESICNSSQLVSKPKVQTH